MTNTRAVDFRARALSALCVTAAVLAPLAAPLSAQTTFSATGANGASIQSTVDAFRLALGPLNSNVAGSAGSGRREINWDGVPDALSDPNLLPANFFNVNSPRGVVFSTPGTGFLTSASATNPYSRPVLFGGVDPSYPTSFTAFSPQRVFTPVGSNVLDVSFFVPGSLSAATTNGFGAVFADVDIASTTSLTFFDASNNSLGTYFVASTAGVGTFSFLGVSFATPVISRVRITLGNTVLAAGATDQNGTGRDVVVLDDFIYGEPIGVSTVPEPASVALMSIGLAAIAVAARRRRHNV